MNVGEKDKRDEQDEFQEPILLDAQKLRSLAETAASLRGPRGDRYFFVQTGPPGRGKLDQKHLPNEPPPDGTVIQLDTSAQQPDRPKVTGACIKAEGKSFSLDRYDAVFWSEAAVEKFVFPYYASKSMWSAAYHLAELSREWYGFIPGRDTPQETGSVPFAIGHVPDSEFETIPAEPGHDLHLFFRDGRVMSVADLLTERKPRVP
jgi:hypothetical protein